jgi:hypothetical protein
MLSSVRQILLEKLGRPLVGAAVLMGVFAFLAPSADAKKTRKKPPLRPLAPAALALEESDKQETPTATQVNTETFPRVQSSEPSRRDPEPAIAYPSSQSVCLYGERKDPKTHKIQCMSPEELTPPRLVLVNTRPLAEQLGMLDGTKKLLMPEQGEVEPPLVDDSELEASSKVKVVRVSFENGAVGGALRNLRDKTKEMAECVETNGGLRVDSARLKLMFFVRKEQKASGIIVGSARNVPPPIVRCIRNVIQETTIGRPSTDAVGVTVLLELRNVD